jgi:hypothetical protein
MNRDPTDGGIQEIKSTIISKSVRCDPEYVLIAAAKQVTKTIKWLFNRRKRKRGRQ